MNNKENINHLKIGVIAISYNEEVDIPGFLESIISWVDEVVIVDDGSQDSTRDIALSYGEKVSFLVSPRKNGEYYSHQRNKGIDASTSQWLLHMDIDERVPPDLAFEILDSIKDKTKDAYCFKRLNFFLNRPMQGGGWQNWNNIHLARRHILRFGGMYHEDHLVNVESHRIGQLNSKMWHLNDSSYLERMTKSNRYCQEVALKVQSNGKKIRWYDLLMAPFKEFLSKLIIRRGYRDGTLGLLWALHASSAMFRAYALCWDKQNSIERSVLEDEIRHKWKGLIKSNSK